MAPVPERADGKQPQRHAVAPRITASDVVALKVAGPPADKLDIVFIPTSFCNDVGPGSEFAWAVDLFIDRIEQFPLWAANWDRINIYRLDVINPDDGAYVVSGNPMIPRSSALQMAAAVGGFDPSNNDQVIALFAVSPDITVARGDPNVVACPYNAETMVVHELGHSFGGLGDEYDGYWNNLADPVYPNCASDTPGYTCEDKWGDLMGINGVGCFENAHAWNWYRPTYNDCVLRSPFLRYYCPVCERTMEQKFFIYTTEVTSVERRGTGVPWVGNCYPNPFGRQTTMSFRVAPGSAAPDVSVYDVRGRRITAVTASLSSDGSGTITWNGRDAMGRPVPSGIYFVRVTSAQGSEVRKVVVTR